MNLSRTPKTKASKNKSTNNYNKNLYKSTKLINICGISGRRISILTDKATMTKQNSQKTAPMGSKEKEKCHKKK